MSNVKRSIYISGSAGLVNKLINFIAVITYARLLTPTELGTFAIASSVMIFAIEVNLLGTTSYLIRESAISSEKVRSALGLAITISWTLAIILILASKLLAEYYEMPDISTLIILLSFNLFLSPFTSTICALLSRKFQFGRLLVISLPSNLAGFLISIVGIQYLELSYLSLAVGQVSTAIFSLLIAIIVRPPLMMFVPAFTNFITISKVGVYTSFISLFGKLESVFADLIFGKAYGPSFVAVFSRAMGLQLFVRDTLVSGISGIVLPYFSKKYREGDCQKQTYIDTSILVTGFVLPPLVCTTLLAKPLILLMFGNQWLESIIFAQILGIWICIKSLTFLANSALITLKKEQKLFCYRATSLLILCISILTIVNIEGLNIAYAFVFSSICEFLLLSILIQKIIKLTVTELLINLKKTGVVILACATTCWASYQFIENLESNIAIIVIEGALLIPTWFAAITLSSHPLGEHLPSLKKIVGKYF